MLEKYLAALLVPYLSKYVENINEDQLKVNIWGGKVALNDLILRPEALDALLSAAGDDSDEGSSATAGGSKAFTSPKSKAKKPLLPIKTYRGICKNVSLSIPIKHLRSEPVVLEVGELLLTLKGVHPGSRNAGGAATASGSSSSGRHERNVKAERWAAVAEAKAKELDAFEAERKRQRDDAENQESAGLATSGGGPSALKGGGGFISRLGELVVNNMIVKVETVHIRYEDEPTETVLGAVLGGVQLLTMNKSTGQPMFTDPSTLQRMWKRLVFNDLQIYCDDPTRVRANAALGRTWFSQMDDWQQWYHRMRQRVRDGNVALSTVLGPVSGSVDVRVVFKLFVRQLLDTPFADVAVQLQYVMAKLTRPQYTKLLQTAMFFTNNTDALELQKFRPRCPVLGHAREWWRYTIHTVRTVLRRAKLDQVVEQISQVCKGDYEVLYREVVRQSVMTAEKKKAYSFVTRFMTVEDMRESRKRVYAQIANEIHMKRKDNEIRKAEEMARQHQASVQLEQAQSQTRGWLSWLGERIGASDRGAAAAQSATAKEIEADEKLFRSIELEYGISAADAEADHTAAADLSRTGSTSSLPPSYCWLRASFDLPLTSYRIDTEHGDFITLKVFQLRGGVSLYNKPSSALFFFRTKNITLENPAAASATSIDIAEAAVHSSSSCGSLVPYLIEGVHPGHRSAKSSPGNECAPMRSLTYVDSSSKQQPPLEEPTIYDVIRVDKREQGLSSQTPPLPLYSAEPSGCICSSGCEEDKRSRSQDYDTPLFSIIGFWNPVDQPLPDTVVDAAIKVQMLPLRIVADPHTIEQLIGFFSPPVGVDVSGFAESTKQAASAVGSAATHEVRAAMAKAKGLYLTVDASAPVLILPKSLDASALEPTLCVSLGRVRLQARPLSEAEKQRRLSAAAAITGGGSDGSSAAPLHDTAANEPGSPDRAAVDEEALYYYLHKASFSKFYLELTTLEWAMRRPQRGFLVVPEVSIAVDVLQRIDDHHTAREAMVLRLRVPSLRVACSVHQIYLITTMVDAWFSRLKPPANVSGCRVLPEGRAGRDVSGGTGGVSPPRLGVEELRCGAVEVSSAGADMHREGQDGTGAPGRGPPTAGNVSSGPVSRASSPPFPKTEVLRTRPNQGSTESVSSKGSSDLPLMRLELLVEGLGLDVHDDNSDTLTVVPLPAFQVECASAELIVAVRSRHKKMLLWLKRPHIVAARDTEFPIFSGGGVRVDVLLSEGDAPVALAVGFHSSLKVCIGTPCVELLETVMDMVNLALSAMDTRASSAGCDTNRRTATAVEASVADRSESGGLGHFLPPTMAASAVVDDGSSTNGNPALSCSKSTASRMSDLEYQIDLVRQQCSMPSRHVADVFVRIPGSITVTLLNRAPGESKDVPFASASMRAIKLRLSKYTVKMDLSGHVGEVSASVLASLGLSKANRTLLAYRPPSGDREPGCGTARPSGSSSGSSSSSSSSAASHSLDQNAHIIFSFRKSLPVMPLFTQVNGKRSLVNAQELRYSSAVELQVGASTITLDLHTVMIFKTYFTAGLFSRISRVAERPLYNGRTLPPTREGPRLLMSMRVAIRDTLVVLPVDPRAAAADSNHRFCVSLGKLILQNSLRAREGHETMGMSLSEVDMWREELHASALPPPHSRESSKARDAPLLVHQRSSLLTTQMCLEMAVRTPIDLQSEDPPCIDIRSEDASLQLQETDLVQLVTLLRQNLTRTDPVDIAAYTLETSEVRQRVLGKDGQCIEAPLQHPTSAVLGDNTSFSRGGVSFKGTRVGAVAGATRSHGALFVTMRMGRISMLLSDTHGEEASNPLAAGSSRFQLHSAGVSMSMSLPSNRLGVQWRSLELDDVRDNTTSVLVYCEAGSLHLADSLTTHKSLMLDFGLRRTAMYTTDTEEEGKMDTGVWCDTKASSRLGDSRANASPNLSVGSSACAPSTRRISESSNTEGHLLTDTQPFTLSVLSADFTLRRFAVSDQWLALSDLVCNEAVMSAWSAAQTGTTSTIHASPPTNVVGGESGGGGAAPHDRTTVSSSRSGMRVVITTPNVVIPFLNSRRETLIEASIIALLADVVQLPTTKQVAVKVCELSVLDVPSGEKILFKRCADRETSSTVDAAGDTFAPAPATQNDREEVVGTPFSPLIGGGGGAAADNASRAPAPSAAHGASILATTAEPNQSEVLHFRFKSDPEANINNIQLEIGELDALVSMPIVQGLVDYFTSPAEPVAKIASLGVMREQRARMAAAAQQMANSTLLVLHVLWRQPRIILAGDAMQLQRRSGNLEMRLGVMQTAVRMNSSAAELSVLVNVQEYSIPSLLKRSALRFAYEARSGVEKIGLHMERTTALFHPADVERLVRLAQLNVLVPRDVNYYGPYEKAVPQPNRGSVAPDTARMAASVERQFHTSPALTPQADGEPPAMVAPPPPPPSRTVQVHINGLSVAVYDTVGVNTHTLTLAALDTVVLTDGRVALWVPSLCMVDQLTGRCMLQSETVPSSGRSQPGTPAARATAAVMAPMGSGSDGNFTAAAVGTNGNAAAATTDAALRVTFNPTERTSEVQIGAVVVTVIPRSLGTLLNTLLSVHIPSRDEPNTLETSSPPTPSAGQPVFANATASTSVRGSAGSTDRMAAAAVTTTAATTTTAAEAVAHDTSAMLFTFTATLVECRVRFCQGDREVAVLRLASIACSSNSYPDGASELVVTLDNLSMIDSATVNTNYRTFIYSYEDAEAGGAPSADKNLTGNTRSVMHTPVVPLDPLVTYEVRTDAAPKADFAQKSDITDTAVSTVPVYRRHMKCRFGSLCFVVVPDVVRTVVSILREAQAHISDCNRDKAYTYVSDRAAESMRRRNETEQLTEFDVLVHRPQVLLVDKPTSTSGVQLSPGSLIVNSRLVLPSDITLRQKSGVTATAYPSSKSPELTEPEAKMAAMAREVFTVHVRKMGMLLQDESCFQKDCTIHVQFERALPTSLDTSMRTVVTAAVGTDHTEENAAVTDVEDGAVHHMQSMLKVDIPVLSMALTHRQTDFAMDVLGALVNGTETNHAVAKTGPTQDGGRAIVGSTVATTSPADNTGGQSRPCSAVHSSRAPLQSSSSRCTTGTGADFSMTATSETGAGWQRDGTAARATLPAAASTSPFLREQSVPHPYMHTKGGPSTSFTLIAHIGFMQADVGDVFRLQLEEAQVLSTDVSTTGKTTDVHVGSLRAQHVGAEVVAPPSSDASASRPLSVSKDARTGPRNTSCVQELVDLLTVTDLHILYVQPQPVIDVDAGSSVVENSVSISTGVFSVSLSPTILFDTREMLYLPFYSKVLRVPIDPIPVLSLMDETTTLQEDVVLDYKHVLWTANRTRCCYVLDLNGHKLVLTDAPSSQIVLYEGCELTITNGTVHIPGMYTIGSYVSFAPSTALFTTDSVRFEKEFLNLPNKAFCRPFLPPPTESSSDGVARGGRLEGPQSPRGAHFSISETSTRAFLMDDRGSAAVAVPHMPHNTTVELRDRTVRLLASFSCDAMEVRMLSEEVVDLSIALRMRGRVKFLQENENEKPMRRSVSLQLLGVRSGESEEHVLLPTDMVMNVSGVESVSVSLVLDSIEFCTRATLLRSLVEIWKDFSAAIIEETTISRVKSCIEYETQSLDPLLPVLTAGECEHCGQSDAYLAPAANRPGILCYKCCTGHDHVPAIDFRVEVPLIDVIMIGSKSDMAHIFMRNVLLSINPSMDLDLVMRMSICGFSNAAAVWEPLIEQFDATISGSVKSHDYKVHTDRFDYVVSPHNLRLVSGMAADYGDAAALQKKLRKRFSRQKQLRMQLAAPIQGSRMYADAVALDEDVWLRQQEEEALSLNNADATGFNPFRSLSDADNSSTAVSGTTASLVKKSMFDTLSEANEQLMGSGVGALKGTTPLDSDAPALPPKRGYAHVYVTSHCDVELSISSHHIAPHGGTLRFVARESCVTISRRVKPDEPQPEGCATNIANPPLYLQTEDMLVETRVVLGQEEGGCHLRRTVTIIIYPLHISRTIICLENRLCCALASTPNNPPVQPSGRLYMAPKADLNTAIFVKPVGALDRVEYEAGKPIADALNGSSSCVPAKMPTLEDVLCGTSFVVSCKAKTATAKSMAVVVYVRQEEMRGGVPTFVIVIASRFRLRNRLPYRLIVNVVPDADGSLAKRKVLLRPVQPLASTVLGARQSENLGLNEYSLNQVAFMLEVRQPAPRTAAVSTAASAASASSSLKGQPGKEEEEEIFTTLIPIAVSRDKPFIILRSRQQRQLVIRATYVTNSSTVTFSTPYVLLNHSPIPLTVRECTRSGENRMYEAEPNFSVLDANMNASIAACPMNIRKSEEFFVNLYHKGYRGTCVPLHAQERGVVIMESGSARADRKKGSSSTDRSSGGDKKKGTVSTASTPAPTVIHLAYSSQVDPNGSVLVIITPRWVLVNRSSLPLYAAPSTYGGITAEAAAAAATTAVVAAQQQKSTEGGCSGELPPKASLTLRQTEVDAMKHVLQDMAAADSILFLSDPPAQVVALPPQSATPLLETPFCGPDVGYNLHILQSPFAPLYGTPVGIENIHSELIIVYKPLSDTSGCAAGEKACWARSKDHSRDRFLEVMLTVKDSYTYIVLEPQAYAPYLLLNRTGYAIDVRDTAAKSKGRLMARVAPGCGTELLLDSTVTTLIQLELFSSDGGRRLHEVSFDVGRPMTRREINDASVSATGVLYTLSFGGHGQQIIEITSAKTALPIAYTSIATPPIPINVLLNVAVVTLSVVMPNKDVLFCAITDVRFSWDRQNDREMTKFSIENFQVDNQTEVSPRYDSCVLSLRTSKSVAAASGYLERILVPSKSLICLEEVRLDVLPLAVRVSDTLLVALASFVQAVRTGEDARQLKQANQSLLGGSTSTFGAQEAAAAATAAHERNPSPTDLYQRAPVQIDIWASRLTLERLIINPIVVRVWLTRDVDEHDFFRENINVKDAALLSMMVSSCEDVVVAAPGIVTAKQSSRLGIFVQWVLKTYTDGLLSRLKGILLQYASSLPMIGAPLKLATGFGSGAVRLFREPIEGLSTSASAFAIGLARGSAGFAQEFAGGGLGALSNITDSWSRLLSMGGGVSERDRRKQNIFTGIARGIKGVIQRPIEGAAESGATGLLKGTAQGLVGVLANPVSGLLSDMSRATGTLAKIVTDTYVPKTRRLRPIRDFYANGGVAPWRSVVSVYQYQRIQASTRTWSGDHLISSVDGPAWYPSKRENLTFGKSRTPIPQDRWILDRFHTNFMGWTYSTKYYGIYSDRLTDNVRVRRMRWTALIRPLPYSRVACYLNVCPGLETQERRTASLASTVTTAAPLESTIVFAQPGALHATTVEHTKARNRRLFGLRPFGQSRSSSVTGGGDRSSKRSSSKSRGANASHLLAEEEEEGEGESTNLTERINERLRSWTAAGRNVGVRGTILRSHSGMLDDNEELPDATEPPLLGDIARAQSSRVMASGGGSTIMVRAPSAPRDRQRRTRSSHSRSNSDLDAILSSGMSGYGDSYTEHRDNRRSRRQNSHDGEQARAATASEFAPETVGSRVPAPARYSRSASGRMLPVNVDGSVAPVPGASPIPAPRTASNANAPPASTIVEVYEYEKKVPMLGWGKRFLPSECPAWQDVHGHEVPSRREIHAPAGWVWVTDWTIIGGAEDGWTILGTEERNLRRRMWQRRLVKQVVPPSPNK